MFSIKQKQEIAEAVERVLLSFEHPEMPTERPEFTLNVNGKESWSWAEIRPNWTYNVDNPPSINPWNEKQEDTNE